VDELDPDAEIDRVVAVPAGRLTHQYRQRRANAFPPGQRDVFDLLTQHRRLDPVEHRFESVFDALATLLQILH